jgi:hypothetical protein
VALRPEAAGTGSLRSQVRSVAFAGGLRVHVGSAGAYSISLRSVDGTLLEKRSAHGPAEFRFKALGAAPALRILTVETQDAYGRYSVPVLF